MVKKIITKLIILAIIAGLSGLKYIARRNGRAYKLALQMKQEGFTVEKIDVKQSGTLFDEIAVSGKALNVKINWVGNALSMQNVINSLEKGKLEGRSDKARPIYVSGNFIVTVYVEPQPGAVKRFMEENVGSVREY